MDLLINSSKLNTFDQIVLNKQISELVPKAVTYSLTFYIVSNVRSEEVNSISTHLKELFPEIEITLKSVINKRTVYTQL